MVTNIRRRRGPDRRLHARADARLSMRVEGTPDDGAASSQVVTETQNISASGVYCMSSRFLAPLSKVALTIVLPKVPGVGGRQELIKCEGIVVRCEALARRGDRRYELACMFSELDRKRRELIGHFVTWRNLQALRAAARTAPKRAARASVANGSPRTTARRRVAAAPSRKTTVKRRTTH
jgi:hypothetical protein